MKTEETFHDIKTIARTREMDMANQFLQRGWRLLKIVTERDEYEIAVYILGWPHDREPHYPALYQEQNDL